MSITDLIAFHQATFELFNVQAGRTWIKTHWTLDFFNADGTAEITVPATWILDLIDCSL